MNAEVEQEPAWLSAVSTSTNLRCAKCDSPLAGDAIVCVACGTNRQTGVATGVSVVAAPREPILNGWLGPLILGGIMIVPSIVGGFMPYGTEAGFAIFALLFLPLTLSWHLWVLFSARKIPGAQLKIWAIPLYNVYYVFAISTLRWLKAFTVGLITIIVMFFIHGCEMERKGYFERSEDEGDNVRVIHGANVPQNVRPGLPPRNDWEPRPDQIPEWDPNRSKATTRPSKSKP